MQVRIMLQIIGDDGAVGGTEEVAVLIKITERAEDLGLSLAESKALLAAAQQRISSAFVEAPVNAVLSKRFAKKQQMQWSRRGAHLLLQTRTRTLDGSLCAAFEHWYPGMMNDNDRDHRQAAA
jgi:DNA-binding transcriptional MerR regulator